MDESSEKNIAFFGTGGIFSNIVLENLVKSNICIKLVFILIKPNSKLRPLNEDFCVQNNLKYIKIEETNTNFVKNVLLDNDIDLGVIASYSQILKDDILKATHDGFVNLHPSFLPYYKGANPLFWQIKDEKDEFGATVHVVNGGIDEGSILVRDKWMFKDIISGDEISKKIAYKGSQLLIQVLSNYIKNYKLISKVSISADELNKGFYNPKPQEDDFMVDLTKASPEKLIKLMNRLKKWGDIFCIYDTQKLIITGVKKLNDKFTGIIEFEKKDRKICVSNNYGSFIVETLEGK